MLNHGRPGRGPRLVPGMALAIEPMITMGSPRTVELDDGWTVVTRDGSVAAHVEHSMALLRRRRVGADRRRRRPGPPRRSGHRPPAGRLALVLGPPVRGGLDARQRGAVVASSYPWQRGEMRAGDADRQAVAERLRVALDEGRLDLHEYDERLQRAYAAKTYGDLDGLLGDLPDPVAPERAQLAPAGGAGAGGPAGARPGRPVPGGDPAVAGRELGALPLRRGDRVGDLGDHLRSCRRSCIYFWPMWVAGPWGAVLLVGTVGGLVGASRSGGPQKAAREAAAERGAGGRAARDRSRSEQWRPGRAGAAGRAGALAARRSRLVSAGSSDPPHRGYLGLASIRGRAYTG